MRALHLFFRLHCPYQLRKPSDKITDLNFFGGEDVFREANRTEYQPFFALLERNAQKYPNFKISLTVSGPWIEQAQKFDPDLIERLHKLTNLGCVQLLMQPYYYSLASFYDQDEFKTQIALHRQKLDQLFGSQTPILALPELFYNDQIGKWGEHAGFQGALAGVMEKQLKWRSVNQVFEATAHKNFRILCQNTRLSHAIMHGWSEATTEEYVTPNQETPTRQDLNPTNGQPNPLNAATAFAQTFKSQQSNKTPEQSTLQTQRSFSAKKFQKHLDLELLRGDLINLCIDTAIFRTGREAGIIRFFDELIGIWAKTPRHALVNAAESLEAMTPDTNISIKTTVNWRTSTDTANTASLAKLTDIQNCPPSWLNEKPQAEASKKLYALRELVLRTKDEKLRSIFGQLTTLDYIMAMNADAPALTSDMTHRDAKKTDTNHEDKHSLNELAKDTFNEILDIFSTTVLEKQPQPAKISATAKTPKESTNKDHDRATNVKVDTKPDYGSEEDDEFSVPIFRVTKVRAQKPSHQDVKNAAEEVQILAQRLSKRKKMTEEELSELTEAEVVTTHKPKRSGRRFMKKLVIEQDLWHNEQDKIDADNTRRNDVQFKGGGTHTTIQSTIKKCRFRSISRNLALLFFDLVTTKILLRLGKHDVLTQNRVVFP